MDAAGFAGLAVVALLIAVYAAVSDRLQRWNMTGPIVFVAMGLLVGPTGLDVVDLGFDNEPIGQLAEVTLALVIFGDASRIDLGTLRRQAKLPLRLLLIGLPLTIVAGGLVAWGLFDGLGVVEAALIGAVLAPTDAALGQAVMADRRVPARVRQALNVESGLNDGLVAPIFAVLLAVVAADLGRSADVVADDRSSWVVYAAEQVGLGALVGIGVGLLALLIVQRAAERGWGSAAGVRLAVLALAVLAWALAGAVGGNGFIAAFVGGFVAGSLTREVGSRLNEFLESEGELLSLLVWMVFGGAIAGPMLSELGWRVVLYAVASLTVVRMVPVALALVGTGLRLDTIALLGWFGPRGLASIVYGVAAVTMLGEEGPGRDVLVAVGGTVLLSVLAHGMTAQPLSRWYAGRMHRMRRDESHRTELQHAPELPPRPSTHASPTHSRAGRADTSHTRDAARRNRRAGGHG